MLRAAILHECQNYLGGGGQFGSPRAIIEDVSINNEYEYDNDFKPYSYSRSFSQLSMLAMTPSSSL